MLRKFFIITFISALLFGTAFADLNQPGRPPRVTDAEETAGTSTAPRTFTPGDIKNMIDIHAAAAATDGDAIHDNVDGEIAAIAAKASPVDADFLLIEDSAASNAKKSVTLTNLWANYLDPKVDALIAATGAVDTSGTPVQYDIARFVDGDTLEGLTYAELAAVPGFESALEAVLDLSDLQGAVTDGQIPAAIARDTELHAAVTLAAGVHAVTLTGQEIGSDAMVEQLADLTPTVNALLGFDASGNLTNKTSISIDLVLSDATPTTDGLLTKTANDQLALGVGGTATYYFSRTDDTAGDGATTANWSANKIFDELALKQNADSELSAIAGLTSAANALPYFTGAGTAAVTTLSSFMRGLLDDGDEATLKASLNLERSDYGAMTVIGSFASPTTTNPYSLTAANAYGADIYYGATGEIDLPAGATGMNIIIYNTGAYTITIDPNGTEIIVRDGTAQSAGVSMTLSSGAGNYVALVFDGSRWVTKGYKGTLAAGS